MHACVRGRVTPSALRFHPGGGSGRAVRKGGAGRRAVGARAEGGRVGGGRGAGGRMGTGGAHRLTPSPRHTRTHTHTHTHTHREVSHKSRGVSPPALTPTFAHCVPIPSVHMSLLLAPMCLHTHTPGGESRTPGGESPGPHAHPRPLCPYSVCAYVTFACAHGFVCDVCDAGAKACLFPARFESDGPFSGCFLERHPQPLRDSGGGRKRGHEEVSTGRGGGTAMDRQGNTKST